MVHRKIPPMHGAIFETPDMITEDKGRGILFGTFSGTGGLVLAGSRRQRLARGDAPPHRHHQRGRHDHHPDGLGDDARSPPRPSVDLDLPTRSVPVGGLERWEMRQGVFKLVEESRLAKMIERTSQDSGALGPRLLTFAPDAAACAGYVRRRAARRGSHGFSNEVRLRGRNRADRSTGDTPPAPREVVGARSGGRSSPLCAGKRQEVDVTPIRFVAGCEKGHLQDIDWRRVVHGDAICHEPMWLVETGTSADPRDTLVMCDCERSFPWSRRFREDGSVDVMASVRGWATEIPPDTISFCGC